MSTSLEASSSTTEANKSNKDDIVVGPELVAAGSSVTASASGSTAAPAIAAASSSADDEADEEKGGVRSPYATSDFVLALWRGRGKYYDAQIESANPDGTFAVIYSDGDYDPKVPRSSLQPHPKGPAPEGFTPFTKNKAPAWRPSARPPPPKVELSAVPAWDDHYTAARAAGQLQLIKRPTVMKGTYKINPEINKKISLWKGDITALAVDAVMNAANDKLMAGGGICGAIHSAAGHELSAACDKIGFCETGNTVITPGFQMYAKHVLHSVGPRGERPQLLAKAYKSALELCLTNQLKTFAFCCLSTGIFGYPSEKAVFVALRTVRAWLENQSNRDNIDRVIMCVFSEDDVWLYNHLMPLFFPVESQNETVPAPKAAPATATTSTPESSDTATAVAAGGATAAEVKTETGGTASASNTSVAGDAAAVVAAPPAANDNNNGNGNGDGDDDDDDAERLAPLVFENGKRLQARDKFGNFSDATIVDVKRELANGTPAVEGEEGAVLHVKVHYNGYSPHWDEWINTVKEADRLKGAERALRNVVNVTFEWLDPNVKDKLPTFGPKGFSGIFNRSAVVGKLSTALLGDISRRGGGPGSSGIAFPLRRSTSPDSVGRVAPPPFKAPERPPPAKLSPEEMATLSQAFSAVAAEDPSGDVDMFLSSKLAKIHGKPSDEKNRVISKDELAHFSKVCLTRETGSSFYYHLLTSWWHICILHGVFFLTLTFPRHFLSSFLQIASLPSLLNAVGFFENEDGYVLKLGENNWPRLLPIRFVLDAISAKIAPPSTGKTLKND